MAKRFIKTTNALLSGSSYLLSSMSGKPSAKGMPVSISFELTNHCNLKCPECASGSDLMIRERGFMDFGLHKKAIFELKPYLYYINLYFQGEPMLHPQFFSFPGLTAGIKTVVSTNGHFLTVENSEKLAKSGLNKLIVSLDGMSQEVYSRYRQKGELEKVISGIRNADAARKKFHSSLKMELQFLVNRYNEHQIQEAERFAKEVDARLRLKSMQVISDNDTEKWMPAASKFRRYEEINGKIAIKNSMPDRCLRLWFNPVITWDGLVIPCCFDKDAEFVMGDLKKESFRTIWNNARYKEFRKNVFTRRKSIGICRNCTSGMKMGIVC
jgi:radical SAM protein with 4Fe4S-binding SPASM domain